MARVVDVVTGLGDPESVIIGVGEAGGGSPCVRGAHCVSYGKRFSMSAKKDGSLIKRFTCDDCNGGKVVRVTLFECDGDRLQE